MFEVKIMYLGIVFLNEYDTRRSTFLNLNKMNDPNLIQYSISMYLSFHKTVEEQIYLNNETRRVKTAKL